MALSKQNGRNSWDTIMCTWKWKLEQDHRSCLDKQHIQNVRGLGLLTSCCKVSRIRLFSVSLYSVTMMSKPLFSTSVICRETEIIMSQMVLGNGLIKMKCQWEECSQFPTRHIQRWRLRFQWWWWRREKQQTRKEQIK